MSLRNTGTWCEPELVQKRVKKQTSEIQSQLRILCNIYVDVRVVSPRFPSVAVLNGRIIKLDHHHVGPVPVRAARRGSEPKLVEPESVVSRRCHVEGEGVMTVCEMGPSFTKLQVILRVEAHTEHIGTVTDADAIYETFPFWIPCRPVACTVDNGDVIRIYRAQDRDVCSCTDIGLGGPERQQTENDWPVNEKEKLESLPVVP